MAADLATMIDDDFDRILVDVVREESVELLIRIPGVYDALREHFNNEVLTRWKQEEAARIHDEYRQKHAWTPTEKEQGTLDGIADDLYYLGRDAVCHGCPVEDDCPFDQDLDCKHLFDTCVEMMKIPEDV